MTVPVVNVCASIVCTNIERTKNIPTKKRIALTFFTDPPLSILKDCETKKEESRRADVEKLRVRPENSPVICSTTHHIPRQRPVTPLAEKPPAGAFPPEGKDSDGICQPLGDR